MGPNDRSLRVSYGLGGSCIGSMSQISRFISSMGRLPNGLKSRLGLGQSEYERNLTSDHDGVELFWIRNHKNLQKHYGKCG